MDVTASLIDRLIRIVKVLKDSEMVYALAGGLAFSTLVEPRATMDIDILLLFEESDNDIRTFFTRLEKEFGTVVLHEQPMRFPLMRIWRAVSMESGRDIIFDFLLAESEFHRNVLERAIEVELLNSKIRVVTLEDLVLLKKCANRTQDRADLEKIISRFDEEIDSAYIQYWSLQLSL